MGFAAHLARPHFDGGLQGSMVAAWCVVPHPCSRILQVDQKSFGTLMSEEGNLLTELNVPISVRQGDRSETKRLGLPPNSLQRAGHAFLPAPRHGLARESELDLALELPSSWNLVGTCFTCAVICQVLAVAQQLGHESRGILTFWVSSVAQGLSLAR